MDTIRQPAVAGMFYPADKHQLTCMISGLLSAAAAIGDSPKALIAPHAGYIYSGHTVAAAYARLSKCADCIKRVILLGPAHRVAVRGLAACSADAFATPLGILPVDKECLRRILALPQVQIVDEAHAAEHSLEVQLPFLQLICPDISIVPLLVGKAEDEEVAQLLEQLWGGPETIIVVSSDLSHYHDYTTAVALDSVTAQAIENLDPAALGYDSACGRIPIRGLLQAARHHGLKVITADLRNSGDTAGSKNRVVGYGAFIFSPA